jgi:hypothetical protein
MRKLKALGLALVAFGAIGAAAAATASANYNIASVAGGTISGTQTNTHEIHLDLGTVKCTSATFTTSQATETADTLTILPSYDGCTLAGVKVTFHLNKCHYLYTKPTTTDALNPPVTTHEILHSKCDTGKEGEENVSAVTIKDKSGLGCEVKIGEQETKGTIMTTNEAAGTVLVESNVEGISYTWTAGCPNAGGKAGSSSNGKYTGGYRLAGKNPKGIAVAVKVT